VSGLRPALLVAVLGALPALAGAQGTSNDPRLAARLDPVAREAVDRIVDSARGTGLPAEPLVQRALQGAARGADGERIAAAVRRLAGELATARTALGPASTPAEVEAGAEAVHAGIEPAHMERLRAAAGDAPLTVALATMADLVAQGVPAPAASQAVIALAARGGRDADVLTLRRDVGRDIAVGTPPAAAAAVRGQGGAGGGGAGGRPANVPRPAKPARAGTTPPGKGGTPPAGRRP
jgi:hypothetical protein